MRSQRGQIVLIVILSLAVALTVGLSVASRVITNLKVSKENEESQRAFQAAEAGLKVILNKNSSSNIALPQTTLSNNAQFSAKQTTIGNATQIVLNQGLDIDQGLGFDVWLSQYNLPPAPNFDFYGVPPARFSGNITIYWGSNTQTLCSPPTNAAEKLTVRPALEVVLLTVGRVGPTTYTVDNPRFSKYVYDPCVPIRIPGATSGAGAGTPVDGISFYQSTPSSINIPGGGPSGEFGLIMKIIPIFASTKIAVTTPAGGKPFPSQGSLIETTGQSGASVRKILYLNSNPQTPVELFPYSILSQ